MKLLTKELEKKLPALYSQEEVEDPIVVAHFFNPGGVGDWWITKGEWQGAEADAENGPSADDCDSDFIMFGLCHIHEAELGYVSLSELAAFRGRFGLGIERDTSWQPKPLSEVKSKAPAPSW
jgi:hypothetical protein